MISNSPVRAELGFGSMSRVHGSTFRTAPKEQIAYVVGHDRIAQPFRQYAPSTIEQLPVERPVAHSQLRLRTAEDTRLKWIEFPQVAGLAARVAYVNAMLRYLRLVGASEPRQIAVVSLGSGYLLTEHLIEQASLALPLKWRCIDPLYRRRPRRRLSGERAVAAFRSSTRQVAIFTNEQAYLRGDGRASAQRDKALGPVVILSCDPPTMIDPRADQGRLRNIGYREHIADANAVFIFAHNSGATERVTYETMMRTWQQGGVKPDMNYIRCSLQADGNVDVRVTPDLAAIHGGMFRKMLEQRFAMLTQPIALAEIQNVCREFSAGLQGRIGLEFHPLLASDYRLALEQLHATFRDSSQVALTASLHRNVNTFATLNEV